jgi:hypothetical protein
VCPNRVAASSIASRHLRPAPSVLGGAARASVRQPAHEWRTRAVRLVVERVAVAGEVEDDIGDARSDIADGQAVAVTGKSFPREPGRPSRREAQVDFLRFTIGRGLPRAPPT